MQQLNQVLVSGVDAGTLHMQQRQSSGAVGRMTVDANDIPPGSRLFLVVPREADPRLLQVCSSDGFICSQEHTWSET